MWQKLDLKQLCWKFNVQTPPPFKLTHPLSPRDFQNGLGTYQSNLKHAWSVHHMDTCILIPTKSFLVSHLSISSMVLIIYGTVPLLLHVCGHAPISPKGLNVPARTQERT